MNSLQTDILRQTGLSSFSDSIGSTLHSQSNSLHPQMDNKTGRAGSVASQPWSDEMKAMSRLKGLGYLGSSVGLKTRLTSKQLKDSEMAARRKNDFFLDREELQPFFATSLLSSEAGLSGKAHQQHIAHGSEMSSNFTVSQHAESNSEDHGTRFRRSSPSKKVEIENAILRAKDSTISRLEEEIDTHRRQTAKVNHAASTKIREQEEKIKDLKNQV
jgi:hypothetical protein